MHMAGPHLAFAVACLSAPCDIHRPTSKPAARMPGFLQSGDKPHAPSTHGPCRPLPRPRRVRGPGPADTLSARMRVELGKRVSIRLDLVGSRSYQKKTTQIYTQHKEKL